MFEVLSTINDRINHFESIKQSLWSDIDLNEKCQEYNYLEVWENNIKCLYTSDDFMTLSKSAHTPQTPNHVEHIQRTYLKLLLRKISTTANNFVLGSLENFQVDSINQMMIFLLALSLLGLLDAIWLIFKSRKVKSKNSIFGVDF